MSKLYYPRFLERTLIKIDILEIGEDGRDIVVESKILKARVDEGTETKRDSFGTHYTITGTVYIHGDPFPNVPQISRARITINGNKREVIHTFRLRDVDGSIHHTKFELR